MRYHTPSRKTNQEGRDTEGRSTKTFEQTRHVEPEVSFAPIERCLSSSNSRPLSSFIQAGGGKPLVQRGAWPHLPGGRADAHFGWRSARGHRRLYAGSFLLIAPPRVHCIPPHRPRPRTPDSRSVGAQVSCPLPTLVSQCSYHTQRVRKPTDGCW